MKCLILGASGLLGYGIYKVLSDDPQFSVIPVVRTVEKLDKSFDLNEVICLTDVTETHKLEELLSRTRPDVVINCVGIVKSLTEVVSMKELYYVNSFFPHILSKITNDKNISLIHFSTDCVFSGKVGNYKEHDIADAKAVYGRSKFYGEVTCKNTLVLRISLIGRELKTSRGLIEWFLHQKEVDGFVNAIFSGMPSVSIGRFIRHYLTQCAKKSGLYHLSADPISKYELLKLVNFRLGKNIKIKPTELPKLDRSLNSAKLRDEFGWCPSNWKQLVDEMCEWQYDKQ